MTRRLVNIGIVLALMLGCGGGTLAAAFCPHADCLTPTGPTVAAAMPSHDGHHAHSADAAAEHQHGEHSASRAPETTAPQSSLLNSHDRSCDHCVGRTSPTPASDKRQRSEGPRRDGRAGVAPLSRPVEQPVADFVREITPHQGAPPGRAGKHILNSVFRI